MSIDKSCSFDIINITDKELLMNIIEKLVKMKDIKLLRKLINSNKTVHQFNPKQLNLRFPLNGYRFTSRGKKLILLKEYYYKNGNETNSKLLKIIQSVSQ